MPTCATKYSLILCIQTCSEACLAAIRSARYTGRKAKLNARLRLMQRLKIPGYSTNVTYDLMACTGIALTFNLPTSTELKLLSSQFRFRYKAEVFISSTQFGSS